MVSRFVANECYFGSFHELPIRFSGSRNPNPVSDLQNSGTLLSNGIWWKMSSERFRDDICESWCLIFRSENSISQRRDVVDVETVRRLHVFLILIADLNSPTPKTPESTFSTQKKIHTWPRHYSLDCREGLAHKNEFVCILVYLQIYGGLIFCKMDVILGVFTNSLLGFRGRGIRIRCQIFEIQKQCLGGCMVKSEFGMSLEWDFWKFMFGYQMSKFYVRTARCRWQGGGTMSILHYFLNLIADSNSATPKTPESKFSTHGKIHTVSYTHLTLPTISSV